MKSFRTTTYSLTTDKLTLPKDRPLILCLLCDLHGVEIGEDNAILLKEIRRSRPDLILGAGDLCFRSKDGTMLTAESLLLACREIAPVYLSLGNHEMAYRDSLKRREAYRRYVKGLREQKIITLDNQTRRISLLSQEIELSGLTLPREYYRRLTIPRLTSEEIEKMLGRTGLSRTPKLTENKEQKKTEGVVPAAGSEKQPYRILLAHNPSYGKAYFDTGADLTLCGHFHGGILRFTRRIGALGPNLIPFPRYCCGDFYRGDQAMVVSAGLGEHTIPLRIHNPRELVIIKIYGKTLTGE